MKALILSIGFALAASSTVVAQNAMTAEFKQYLTDNNLWEQWRENRARFDCPGYKKPEVVDKVVAAALKSGQTLPYRSLSVSAEQVSLGIETRAEVYKERYEKDKNFFEKAGLGIIAAMNRLPPEVRNRSKIIVTDISGSMDPYAEQVLLWHEMNLGNEQHIKYVFFNDGNDIGYENKPKVIGATGGIYTAEGNREGGMLKTLSKMMEGMRNGNGGDWEENDVEALVEAQEWLDDNDKEEIVLIADGTSPMRDLVLVSELKVPVRVILCGVTEFKDNPILNEYALLAHLTGGSVHTIEQDLWDLEANVQDKTFQTNGKQYELKKGVLKPSY